MSQALKLDADGRLSWWILLGVALLSPFVALTGVPIAWDHIPLMDWQRLFEIAAVLLSMAWMLVSAPPLRVRLNGTFLGWMIFFLLGLSSAWLVADQRTFALLDWSWLLLLVSTVAMLRHWGLQHRDRLAQLLMGGALASATGYLIWFWALNAGLYLHIVTTGDVIFPGFSNLRYFSDYQTYLLILLPTALYRLTSPVSLLRRLGSIAVAGYFTLAMLCGSRSLVAAHLLLHATMLLLMGKRYWPFLALQLRFWAYGLVIYGLVTWLPPLLAQHAGAAPSTSSIWRTDSSSRTVLWQIALDIIGQFPWLGLGPMHYASVPNAIAAHPHNLILQFASEWGLPATGLLVWLVGKDLWQRIQVCQWYTDDLGVTAGTALTLGLVAMLLQSMVAGSLNYPNSQVLALLCFAYPMRMTTNPAVSSSSNVPLAAIGLFAAALFVGTLTQPQSLQARNNCYQHHPWPSPLFGTRFWQQGWIIGPCGAGQALLSGVLDRPVPAQAAVSALDTPPSSE